MNYLQKTLLFIFHIVSLFIFTNLANAYTNPGTPTAYVSDYADVMTQETEALLNQMLYQLEASTSAQIAIVTIQSLEGDYIENYAEKLFQDWGIGQAKEDNGLLLLVVINDREVRIETGYGLEPIVTDAQANRIIQNTLIPAFKQEQYALGIAQATDQLVTLIQNDTGGQEGTVPKQVRYLTPNTSWLPYLFFLFPFIQWLFAIMARSKSIWLGGIVGGILGAIIGTLGWIVGLGLFGLFLDAIISRGYKQGKSSGHIPWYAGGNRGFGSGSSSGGFGGFSGGRSGGGGASGRW